MHPQASAAAAKRRRRQPAAVPVHLTRALHFLACSAVCDRLAIAWRHPGAAVWRWQRQLRWPAWPAPHTQQRAITVRPGGGARSTPPARLGCEGKHRGSRGGIRAHAAGLCYVGGQCRRLLPNRQKNERSLVQAVAASSWRRPPPALCCAHSCCLVTLFKPARISCDPQPPLPQWAPSTGTCGTETSSPFRARSTNKIFGSRWVGAAGQLG